MKIKNARVKKTKSVSLKRALPLILILFAALTFLEAEITAASNNEPSPTAAIVSKITLETEKYADRYAVAHVSPGIYDAKSVFSMIEKTSSYYLIYGFDEFENSLSQTLNESIKGAYIITGPAVLGISDTLKSFDNALKKYTEAVNNSKTIPSKSGLYEGPLADVSMAIRTVIYNVDEGEEGMNCTLLSKN